MIIYIYICAVLMMEFMTIIDPYIWITSHTYTRIDFPTLAIFH